MPLFDNLPSVGCLHDVSKSGPKVRVGEVPTVEWKSVLLEHLVDDVLIVEGLRESSVIEFSKTLAQMVEIW